MTESAEEFARRLFLSPDSWTLATAKREVASRDESIRREARHAALAEAEKVAREWPDSPLSDEQRAEGFSWANDLPQRIADAIRRLREGE